MFKIELKEGTSVFTTDGKEAGKINRFILDPATNEVTHLVVQKGWLFAEDKVVPFDMVNYAAEDKILLNEDIEDFEQLPPFEEEHYIRVRDADLRSSRDPIYPVDHGGEASPLESTQRERSMEEDISRHRAPSFSRKAAYYWYPPHGYVGYPVGFYGWPPMETIRNIPEDTIPLREGTDVISSDGQHVGDIERLFISADSNRATHFAISQGLFFKDRKLVPAHWVKSVAEDRVQLAVSAELLERLPDYVPNR